MKLSGTDGNACAVIGARQPSQLDAAASHFLLLGVLLWTLSRLRRHSPAAIKPCGLLSALCLVIYGGLRFLTDFYRADDTYWGLFSDGQWASLLIAAGGLVLLACLRSLPSPQPQVLSPGVRGAPAPGRDAV